MSENVPALPETTPPVEPSLPTPVPSTPAPSSPPPSSPGMTSRRPTGITIIAILALISGFFGLCCSSPLLLGLSTIGIVIPSGITQVLGVLGFFLACILAFGPVLQLVFAYGAWNLRPWAWWLGIIATGLAVAGVIVNIVGSGGAMVWTVVTNALLPIIIFVYLLLPNTRKAFNM